MSQTVYIYVLRDPQNDKIRYVGKTIQKLNDRLTAHIRQARRENKSHKDRWILQVIRSGCKPTIELVEDANDDNWQDREKYWIVKYYEDGYKLTNETDGGEGLHGHKFSKQHRDRLGQAQLGNQRFLNKSHSEETKQIMSAQKMGENNPNYGKEFSEDHIDRLVESHTGLTHSEETKQKQSVSAEGNQNAKGYAQTEEHKRKLFEARNRTCTHCNQKIKRQKRNSPIYVHRSDSQRECEGMATFAE